MNSECKCKFCLRLCVHLMKKVVAFEMSWLCSCVYWTMHRVAVAVDRYRLFGKTYCLDVHRRTVPGCHQYRIYSRNSRTMDGWRGTQFDTNWKDKTAVDWTDVFLDSEGMGHGGSTRNCYKFFEDWNFKCSGRQWGRCFVADWGKYGWRKWIRGGL